MVKKKLHKRNCNTLAVFYHILSAILLIFNVFSVKSKWINKKNASEQSVRNVVQNCLMVKKKALKINFQIQKKKKKQQKVMKICYCITERLD